MTTPDLDGKLSLLEYSKDWVEAGILTETELDRQLQEFSTGKDDNKEHYRYRVLTVFLKDQNTISDSQVEQIIKVLRNDPDESMASSALIGLLKMPYLSDTQFGLVKRGLYSYGNWTERHIEKQQAIRRKKSGSG